MREQRLLHDEIMGGKAESIKEELLWTLGFVFRLSRISKYHEKNLWACYRAFTNKEIVERWNDSFAIVWRILENSMIFQGVLSKKSSWFE